MHIRNTQTCKKFSHNCLNRPKAVIFTDIFSYNHSCYIRVAIVIQKKITKKNLQWQNWLRVEHINLNPMCPNITCQPNEINKSINHAACSTNQLLYKNLKIFPNTESVWSDYCAASKVPLLFKQIQNKHSSKLVGFCLDQKHIKTIKLILKKIQTKYINISPEFDVFSCRRCDSLLVYCVGVALGLSWEFEWFIESSLT